jgi:hypothetical protein
MTNAEIRAVAHELEREPSFFLRMMVMHPNHCSELAANELLVREIKKGKDLGNIREEERQTA